jgi:hypothetical protein
MDDVAPTTRAWMTMQLLVARHRPIRGAAHHLPRRGGDAWLRSVTLPGSVRHAMTFGVAWRGRPRTAAAATTVIGKMFLLGGYSSHFGLPIHPAPFPDSWQ